MGFLDDLSKVVSDFAQTAKEKAGDLAGKTADLANDLAEKGKLQAAILKLKRQITVEQKRTTVAESELGKLAYRNCMLGEQLDLMPACDQVKIHLLVIAELQQKLDELNKEFPDEVKKADEKENLAQTLSAEEIEENKIAEELEQKVLEIQKSLSNSEEKA